MGAEFADTSIALMGPALRALPDASAALVKPS